MGAYSLYHGFARARARASDMLDQRNHRMDIVKVTWPARSFIRTSVM